MSRDSSSLALVPSDDEPAEGEDAGPKDGDGEEGSGPIGFWPAFVYALGELTEVPRNTTGQIGQRQYSYADLGAVLSHVRPVLAQWSLALWQEPEEHEAAGLIRYTTKIRWVDGTGIDVPGPWLIHGDTAHERGSAETYARRYALLSALGLGTEDDDGASAASTATRAPREPASGQPPPRTADEAVVRELMGKLPVPPRYRLMADVIDVFGARPGDVETGKLPELLEYVRGWCEAEQAKADQAAST